jgi:uncharacterized protein (TIGR00299 family) protein
MGKTLYLQCDTGISGDMVVGALLDLGASEKGLRAALASLHVGGYEVRVTRKRPAGIDACDFDVVLDADHQGHDHDMDYLYGGLNGNDAHHEHAHHHEHDHAHHHEHDHAHHHGHEHRTPADVARIIDGADLTLRAKDLAHRIFTIVADAEAKAHGVPLQEVHFHEVGAVDSIVDVVSAAYCLDNLGITDAYVSPLAEGTGQVRVAHGVLSVPVPAVVNIVADCGLVLSQTHRVGEFVTPTGAAIAAAVRTLDQLPAAYKVLGVGVGCGKRAYDPPSTVRALLIQPVDAAPRAARNGTASPEACGAGAPLWKLETEVDDCTGEALGHALSHLYQAGANEAHYLPVYMKKCRPGYQIEVLCAEDRIAACEQVLFEDTTTIGIRRYPVERTALPRSIVEVQTSMGAAKAKRVVLPGGEVRAYPEYESVAALVAQKNLPYQVAYRLVAAAANAE